MKPHIGILTSGGDCPGLNAVLRGVVVAAEKLGWDVVGFRDGFEGLLPPGNHVVLDRKSTDGIMALGGTIIGTTNRGHFVAKTGAGDRTVVPPQVIADAKNILDELQVKALIIVGGDGSMVTAQQLQEAGINCIGVPKTIDNDLEATAATFGFDSAVDVVVDALDRLHTTATSHGRVMVVEVMGRHAGWIALHGGIAGGADVILIPEIPFDYDKIASAIKAREAAGYLGTVVVVAPLVVVYQFVPIASRGGTVPYSQLPALLAFALMAQFVAKILLKQELTYMQSYRLLSVSATPHILVLLLVVSLDWTFVGSVETTTDGEGSGAAAVRITEIRARRQIGSIG